MKMDVYADLMVDRGHFLDGDKWLAISGRGTNPIYAKGWADVKKTYHAILSTHSRLEKQIEAIKDPALLEYFSNKLRSEGSEK